MRHTRHYRPVSGKGLERLLYAAALKGRPVSEQAYERANRQHAKGRDWAVEKYLLSDLDEAALVRVANRKLDGCPDWQAPFWSGVVDEAESLRRQNAAADARREV